MQAAKLSQYTLQAACLTMANLQIFAFVQRLFFIVRFQLLIQMTCTLGDV